jgi:hypothetical protein
MSSKAYITRQIKEILEKKFEKSEEEIDSILETKKNDKVYELLVYKKELRNFKLKHQEDEQDFEDVSISTRLKN